MIRLFLVDDHHVVRRGLRSYFESFPDIKISGEAATAEDLLQNIDKLQADVVLLDLLLPGGMDGLEAARRIRDQYDLPHILILTAYTDPARALAALRIGVEGYVRKDSPPEILLAAVRTVANGQVYLDDQTVKNISEEIPETRLSLREQEVLEHLASGNTNREIASSLMISEETVKSHVSNILSKLGLENRSQAIAHALINGLVRKDS